MSLSNLESNLYLKELKNFERIDNNPAYFNPEYAKSNAVHDTLSGDDKIEIYEVYRKLNAEEVYCIVRFGGVLNGHPNIVHGGIICLAIDNTFGWLFIALGIPVAFTANLNVNFRYFYKYFILNILISFLFKETYICKYNSSNKS